MHMDVTKIVLDVNALGYKNTFPLYTKQALADRWGVNRQGVNNWATRHNDFCKPVEGLVIGGGSYYPLYEVERYEKLKGLKVDGRGN